MLLIKSRIYEKNLFKNIFKLPIDFSKDTYDNFMSLCKKSEIREYVKYLDLLFTKNSKYLSCCIEYIFDKPVESWLAVKFNIDLGANHKDYRFPTDYLCCVRCRKYFLTSYVDDGGICPRKGCNSIYSLGCDCEVITHTQRLMNRIMFNSDTEYEPTESEDNSEHDIFQNVLKDPTHNCCWGLECKKCGMICRLNKKNY